MRSLDALLSAASNDQLTVDKIKTITGIDDSALAAEFMVKLTILESKKMLSMKNLLACHNELIKKYKLAQDSSVEHFTTGCEEVATAVLRLSDENKKRREDYYKKYDEWAANPQKLGEQVFRKATHSCEPNSNLWNRKRTCEEENGPLWEDHSENYKQCGQNGLEWYCRKNSQLLSQEVEEMRSKEPRIVLEPLPSLECLTCSQNISFTGDNIVDETSLQQAIKCSIGNDSEKTDRNNATEIKDSGDSTTSPAMIIVSCSIMILVAIIVLVAIYNLFWS